MAWHTEVKYWDNGTRRVDIYPDGAKAIGKATRRLGELGIPFRVSNVCCTHDSIKEFTEIRKSLGKPSMGETNEGI